MARIKDSSVEAVKQVADIVTVVEGYVRLRKSGGRFVGLCPFHQEKTPSFGISPDRGTYKCFGCGEGGDAISFVEKIENVDFVGAIEWLADRFNVPLEYEESSPAADAARRKRERLHALLEQAAVFYERYLWESAAGEPVRVYLTGRALEEPICREFRLGLSPGGNALVPKAREKGFTQAELAAAGLITRRGSDYFASRLMFPLTDARGRVVGFQARTLRKDDPRKYVNSPEGELFHKSAILYGLNLSRAAIAKQDRAIVVEGNTDVIALRQAGLQPVVASMGTALTEQQLRELSRLTKRLVLCFDSDAAGEEATLRGMELALRQGFDVKVVSLPLGSDPADDPAGFEGRLAQAEPYAVHRIKLEIVRSRDKSVLYLRGQEILNGIAESPERQEAWRLLNDHVGMTVQLRAAGGQTMAGGAVSPKLLEASDRLELSALAGVRAHPKLGRILAELGSAHFDDPLNRRAVPVLIGVEDADKELTSLLAELDARAAAEGIDELTAEQLLLRLRERKLQRELADAEEARMPDLQQALAKVRDRIREFA
jgi:DNA primase